MRIFNPDQDIAQAQAAMKQQAWPEAVKRWQKILKKYRQRTPPVVYARLSVAYRKQAAYTEAQAALNQGLFKFPDFLPFHIEHAEIATYLLDRPEAIRRWQAVVDKFGKEAPAKVWLKLSRAYRQSAKLQDAERAVRRGLSQYPDDSDLKLEAAKVSSSGKDWSEAARRWQAVADELGDKTPAEAWAGLAKAQRMLGRFKQSEATVKQALSSHQGNFKLQLELAEIALGRRDWTAALGRWQELLEKFRGSPALDASIKSTARFNVSVLKRLAGIEAYRRQIKEYAKPQNRKIVIYTSVSKGYDTLKPPEVIDPRFDYVVYSDGPLDGMGIYDVRPLPEPHHDDARAIRYPKTHPHILLPEYDVAIWLDASIMLVGDIYPTIERFLKSGQAIGSCPHSERKSVYEEFKACLRLKKDDPGIIKRQMDFYQSVGFSGRGLTENGFLAFDLKDKRLGPALETWWQQILRFSKRDQLSFSYALQQHKVAWYHLTEPPRHIRNHPDFVVTEHHSEQQVLGELVKLI